MKLLDKMVKKFQINLSMSNKLFYTLIVVSVIGLLSVGVYAYNSGVAPSVMGHSAEEIEGIEEADPTVLASVKDGVSWDEITSKPAGFGDNIDNEGGYSEFRVLRREGGGYLSCASGWTQLTKWRVSSWDEWTYMTMCGK